MKKAFIRRQVLCPASALLLLAGCGVARAFPPAPYYTVFGTIRDESGAILATDGARVVLLKSGVAVLQAPVTGVIQAGKNYELRIPIDMMRAATTLYREDAVVARQGFKIAVEMNGQRFYPLAVASSLPAGGGGERQRLDFAMGVDSDNDGLPDSWEEWQLQQAGHPDPTDLSAMTRDGDLDGDGVSDYEEYIQGTYAADHSSRLFLEIRERTDTAVRLRFDAVAGRVYQVQRSFDLLTWRTAGFSVRQPGFANESWVSPATEPVDVFLVPGPETKVFFRLVAQ